MKGWGGGAVRATDTGDDVRRFVLRLGGASPLACLSLEPLGE